MINATGLQTNAIVVSIRVELAEEFESLFAAEEFRVAMHLVDGEMRLVLRLAEEAPGLLRHRAAGNGFLGRARAMLP